LVIAVFQMVTFNEMKNGLIFSSAGISFVDANEVIGLFRSSGGVLPDDPVESPSLISCVDDELLAAVRIGVSRSLQFLANQPRIQKSRTKPAQRPVASRAISPTARLQMGRFEATLGGMPKLQKLAETETDEELAALAVRRGTPADSAAAKSAFTSLYMRHSRLLRAFLSSRCSASDLDDIEQTIWEKVWDRLPDQYQCDNFRAWLYQITRNYLVDFWRRSRPDELPETFDVRDRNEKSPDAKLLDGEQMDSLERCLNKLTGAMATIVRGRLRGDSYEELCEAVGVDNAKAQRLLFTAKQLLQSCVEGGRK